MFNKTNKKERIFETGKSIFDKKNLDGLMWKGKKMVVRIIL